MQQQAFILMPGFSAMAFFSALEPLRTANRLSGSELYRWTIHDPGGGDARASNGMDLRTDGALPSAPDALIVCAGFDPLDRARAALLGQVRRLWRLGCRVGAIDTGVFVLAEAGILGRDPVTLHWEAADAFSRRYPQIPVSSELYERHARLFTCAGGTAAMDMMLDEIAGTHGGAFAGAVSDQLIHDRIRPASSPQRRSQAASMPGLAPALQRLIERMERGIGERLSLESILAAEGTSRRQAERLFRRGLGQSPAAFYRSLRIRHAITLMETARMPVHEAALAAGFSSQPVFSRACRQTFAKSPRELLGQGDPTSNR